ncbi:hypothetical protein TRICI_005240 [Trichomonascus ciferrii]|uniref:Aldehyde dehydrogenase domain-containing protein n=1 Tax=Trichomonascus ciferrii TaxID=44093 RepID=A0A642V185_9ASCO|nr:hypothetical protein TRICI_005240 [Trichomonascus ciferrii]
MSQLEAKLKAPSGLEYTQPLGLFINNEFVEAKGGDSFEVYDPSTADTICKVQSASEEDVDKAVSAARAAFKGWKKTPCFKRSRLMNKLADLIERDMEKIATIEAWDGGKAYHAQALPNIQGALMCFRYYAGYADKIEGKTMEPTGDKLCYTVREPLGVCGQIIPWNYPFLMAAWKVAPAITAGNAIVLKLAENTPLSMLYFAKLVQEAGFPPGVINIINGLGRVAGAALAAHMDVDKIAFTGSTATGKQIMKLAASNLKQITLECGGKSPMIVFDDADIDLAVKAAHGSLMANQGQTCTAMSRYFVHEKVHDKFVEAFKKKVLAESKIALPFEEGAFHGPQISDVQQKKVLEYIEAGKSEGGNVAFGGQKVEKYKDGYYVEPTLFTGVKDNMKIMREEIFGPVGAVATFSTEEEAIERANDTSYGLGASIFTKDIGKAQRVSLELQSGQVWINTDSNPDPRVPFGGYKSSGIGRELGNAGIEIYTQDKSIHLGFPKM